MHVRTPVALLTGALLVLGASCSSDGTNQAGSPAGPSGSGGATGSTINIPRADIYGATGFQPANLLVPAGTTVTWRNQDTEPHTSISKSSQWEADIPPGGVFTRQFTAPGTYEYVCEIHEGMAGRVTVE